MSDFKDTFNRADSANPGNNWKFKAKAEGDPANIWRIINNKTAPHTDPDISTIMYRANPVGVGASYSCRWKFLGMVGVENAEMCFRYSATGGNGNKRYSIITVGTSGTLRERYWNGTSQVEVTVGSWVRVADNDYTVTVYVSGDNITIYDTNFTGPDNLALELTSTYNNQHTGLGMGSGVFDEFEILDLDQLASADFDFSPATCRITTDLRLEVTDPAAGDYPEAVQHYAGIEVGAYVVIDGIPQAPQSASQRPTDLALGTETLTDTGELLDPTTVVTGALQRWRSFPNPLNGANWDPYVGSGVSWLVPQLADPTLELDYTYSTPYGPATSEAVCFNGAGYIQLQGAVDNGIGWTVAFTGVFKSGRGPKYAIARTDESMTVGVVHPLGLAYSHGRISVDMEGEMLGYESQKLSGGPAVIILSVDIVNDTGQLLVQDRSRVTRSFVLNGADTHPGLFVGADMTVVDEFNADTAGEMDLFEINRWERPLTMVEMLQHANLMNACYGVT